MHLKFLLQVPRCVPVPDGNFGDFDEAWPGMIYSMYATTEPRSRKLLKISSLTNRPMPLTWSCVKIIDTKPSESDEFCGERQPVNASC
jgi:hypothetical protein